MELVTRITYYGLGRGLLPYHVASSSIQPFGHNKHGPKTGWGCALCFWATAYFDIKWHLGPSSRLFMEMGRKLGLCPFRGAGVGSQSNTMLRRPTPTSVPSGILIHPAIWQQQIWAENWGLRPLLGKGQLGPHLTQCGQGRGLPAYQVSSWSIQPFGHNIPTTQTGQTDNGLIAQSKPLYKWSPKNSIPLWWSQLDRQFLQNK